MVGVGQHEEVKELTVVQEEEPCEDKSLLFEVLVHPLLQLTVIVCQFRESGKPPVNH